MLQAYISQQHTDYILHIFITINTSNNKPTYSWQFHTIIGLSRIKYSIDENKHIPNLDILDNHIAID
jgi:hypothetical protein